MNNLDNIPQEMQVLSQWVLWGVDKKNIKCPYNPNNPTHPAKANNPNTWGTFDQAVKCVREGAAQGIGFEFTESDSFWFVDLDTVLDPETGEVDDCALEIVRQLDSYTEISLSGYGLHIICRADIEIATHKKPLPANGIIRKVIDQQTGKQKVNKDGTLAIKAPEIEMYNTGRYVAMTGNIFQFGGVA